MRKWNANGKRPYKIDLLEQWTLHYNTHSSVIIQPRAVPCKLSNSISQTFNDKLTDHVKNSLWKNASFGVRKAHRVRIYVIFNIRILKISFNTRKSTWSQIRCAWNSRRQLRTRENVADDATEAADLWIALHSHFHEPLSQPSLTDLLCWSLSTHVDLVGFVH